MGLDHLHAWFIAHHDGLIAGAIIAAAIVAGLLLVRWLGQRALERDPEQVTWRAIIGRAFAKTFLFFIIAAAADSFSNYAALPHGLARIIDIAFIIAFAFQGAIWAREFILGLVGRRVAEENGGGTLGNAMAIIRVLVSVALFAIAIILILDNLGVNVTALVAGLGIGGIAIGLAAQGILRPVRGAFDPVRQAVQEGRHDPLRQQHWDRRTDRPQDDAHPLAHRRAADHGQHQAARARNP